MLVLVFILVLTVDMVIITMFILVPTMLFTVMRGVFVVIPIFLYEIDGLAAGIVLAAVFTPIFGVAVRHMQVKRWAHHTYRRRPDYYGCRVDELRRLREIADVYAAI